MPEFMIALMFVGIAFMACVFILYAITTTKIETYDWPEPEEENTGPSSPGSPRVVPVRRPCECFLCNPEKYPE